MRRLAILFLLVAQVALAVEYSFSHLTYTGAWTSNVAGGVGIVGGIPTRTNLINITQAPYNADNTGVVDATAAINAAIVAAAANDVIYFPAGTYRSNGIIIADQNHGSNITFRGTKNAAGAPTSSIVSYYTGQNAIAIGVDSMGGTGDTVTGMTMGNDTLTMADTSAYTVGGMIQLSTDNQLNSAAVTGGAYPVFHVSGYAGTRRMTTVVKAKTSTTLTISPKVYYTTSLTTRATYANYQLLRVGIEDLTLDCTNADVSYGIYYHQANECWLQNVRVIKATNAGVFIDLAVQMQMRHCYMDQLKGNSANGGGITVNTASATLIEDNIIYKSFPNIEVNFGWTGCVIAYNYLLDSTTSGAIGASMDGNHGPHNSYDLYEGNIWGVFQIDGYFGTGSDGTVFRNWGTSVSPGASPACRIPVLLNRGARGFELVGNLWGTDGQNVATYGLGFPYVGVDSPGSPVIQPTLGTFWADWALTGTLTTRTSATAGVITLPGGVGSLVVGSAQVGVKWSTGLARSVNITAKTATTVTFDSATGDALPVVTTAIQAFGGVNGYAENDADVQASCIFKANYNTQDDAIPVGEAITTTLPDSLYLAAKPSWFGYLTYPAFNSSAPNFSQVAIPAGYRYVNGFDPPTVPVGQTTMQGNAKITGNAALK